MTAKLMPSDQRRNPDSMGSNSPTRNREDQKIIVSKDCTPAIEICSPSTSR